jgi:hypothetical protein
MEQQQQRRQQQEPQQPIHRDVLDGIARLDDPEYRAERHKLIVRFPGFYNIPLFFVVRQSLQHLVDFLDDCHDNAREEITELELHDVELREPSDGGLEVLCTFFARSDTTLKKLL